MLHPSKPRISVKEFCTDISNSTDYKGCHDEGYLPVLGQETMPSDAIQEWHPNWGTRSIDCIACGHYLSMQIFTDFVYSGSEIRMLTKKVKFTLQY